MLLFIGHETRPEDCGPTVVRNDRDPTFGTTDEYPSDRGVRTFTSVGRPR